MHADRTNRVVLTIFAIILLAAGVVGVLVGFGVFGSDLQHRVIQSNRVSIYYGGHGAWLWFVTALGALIVVVLALRWLLTLLFSTDRAHNVRLSGDRTAGRTTLVGGALSDAVAEEIESYPGVHASKARLIGEPTRPVLVVTATLEQTADLAALRRRIENGAITHARQALDDPQLPVQLDLTVTDRQAQRVS